MTDDAGNLSIDFLAGFAIFMVAFIYVATMIPSLLIGLQSNTIDYDAVAYRTGVILVEDPGMPVNPPWETRTDLEKDLVVRFGLSLSKDTPNILSSAKVDRFFCSTAFSYPDDYHQRVIFGDYPYHFNISVQETGSEVTRSIGDLIPDGYGYIRRVVKIKGTSNATIGTTQITAHNYQSKDNVTTDIFSVHINCTKLLEQVTNPAYQIDPRREQIVINLTDLSTTVNPPPIPMPITNLSSIIIYRSEPTPFDPFPPLAEVRTYDTPYIDDNSTAVLSLPHYVNNSVSLIFPGGFFYDMASHNTQLYINYTFEHDTPSWYLNSSVSGPFDYNYYSENVTQPQLYDGIVEVAVW
ncbi:MAG: hypothetical protein WC391_03990 [Methanoregula sp.]|jgi:hypothetical protein